MDRIFQMFCTLYDFDIGYGVGEIHLEYNHTYGYSIRQGVEETGATNPFNISSLTRAELITCLEFAINVKLFKDAEEES